MAPQALRKQTQIKSPTPSRKVPAKSAQLESRKIYAATNSRQRNCNRDRSPPRFQPPCAAGDALKVPCPDQAHDSVGDIGERHRERHGQGGNVTGKFDRAMFSQVRHSDEYRNRRGTSPGSATFIPHEQSDNHRNGRRSQVGLAAGDRDRGRRSWRERDAHIRPWAVGSACRKSARSSL